MDKSNAHGLLKNELLELNSFLIKTAYELSIPAGKALTVDREIFSKKITEMIFFNDKIEVINQKVCKIPKNEITVIAGGPLITKELFDEIGELTNKNSLFFFDAIAPIIYADSIEFDENCVFRGNRYEESGKGDYINCLMNKEEYEKFYDALINAELHQPESFEKNHFFQGCMPVEEIASRGIDSLRFGCMKPVGFRFKDGKKPYAVVQLRSENKEETIFNIVGFQTRLKYGEQERVFRLIPGLKNADFARKGSMHRNSYIHSPEILNSNLSLKSNPNVFVAGQLTGVEGYVESIAMGLIAGINSASFFYDEEFLKLSDYTMIKSLINYITSPEHIKKFQPINSNYGIIVPLKEKIRDKKTKYLKYFERSMSTFKNED
jgi:methylenetetrahydrofolate--tRNA-(uracil-5-)-methyltransferase